MSSNISPKQFYYLVLEDDPSFADQCISSIPLDSRHPYVSFRNEEDEETFQGQTALHAAARAGHDELVHLLLESNSDRDARKADEGTPIFIASQNGHDRVVELLLAAGADINAANYNGATPIIAAAFSGHENVVKLLVAAGADKDAPEKYGATPLYVAASSGQDNVVKLLINSDANKDAANLNGTTPIMAAAYNGHVKVVELLLAAGADKDAAKNDGSTPIFAASETGHDKVVELLLAAGADKDAAMNNGYTPIWVAAENGNDKVVELLLAAGADKNAAMNAGMTAIHSRAIEQLDSPLPKSTIDAYHSRQSQLIARLAEARSVLFPSMQELPFNELQNEVSPSPAPQSPPPVPLVDSLHLNNFLIPLENLKIERTSVAEGAEGRVYRAEYLGSRVAVKKLTNPDASFRKELEKWCHFRHPNILLLIGFSQPSDSLPWIVMELMDNSLYDLLKNHKIDLSWESRLKMAHGIAAGLVYLHEIRQIIHRDIKSLNILVKGRDYEIKIADFGASRGNTSLISKIAGTPRWLAPELYENHPPTFAVDIYAFGITMNELSTREPPFLELGKNTAAITKAVISNQRPKMEPFPSTLSTPAWYPQFVGLIQRCWDQVPLQRPSATLVLQALSQILAPPIPTSSSLPSTSTSSSTPPVFHYDSYLSQDFTFFASPPIDTTLPPGSPSTPPPTPVVDSDWNTRSWLTSIGIAENIILLFESNDLDDREDIRNLSEKDLTELGIKSMGSRKKILRFAQIL